MAVRTAGPRYPFQVCPNAVFGHTERQSNEMGRPGSRLQYLLYMAFQLNSVVDGLYQLNVEWWWISNDLFTYHEDTINIDRRTYILIWMWFVFMYWIIAFCKCTSLKRSKRFTQKVLIGQLKNNYSDGNRQFTKITLYFGTHKKNGEKLNVKTLAENNWPFLVNLSRQWLLSISILRYKCLFRRKQIISVHKWRG